MHKIKAQRQIQGGLGPLLQEIWGILQPHVTFVRVTTLRMCTLNCSRGSNLDDALSINPKKTSAYSEDLRWRMVWQKEGLGLCNQDVASNLGVDPSTVSRVVSLFKATGSVQKRPYPKDARPSKKLTKTVELMILHAVLQRPGIYLRELQTEVFVLTGVDVSATTLCTFLHGSKFTRQKMQLVAKQRDKELRDIFTIDVSLYKSHQLVFVDETGTDCRDTVRKYGYGLRGRPPRSCKFLIRGERINVITAMNQEGILALRTVRGSVNGDDFLEFVQKDLLPALMPFNGHNPNSIVILDNCSIHHVSGVASMITQVGALVHFLPPYSPDLNPIEECFSKVKSQLKSFETTFHDDLETHILSAFSCITPDDCKGWISDSTIYNSN